MESSTSVATVAAYVTDNANKRKKHDETLDNDQQTFQLCKMKKNIALLEPCWFSEDVALCWARRSLPEAHPVIHHDGLTGEISVSRI